MPDAVVRAPAPVTELAPSDTASFEMITPSTTKSGWPAPRIDVMPRICTRPPLSTMVAPRTGVAPNVRVTLPVTCRAVACARTVAGIRHKAKSAAANTNVLRMPCLPFLDGCCRWNTLPRKYGGRSETPQPRGFSLRRLPFRSTAFRPNQNHAAPTPTPLELRRGAEQVRVDLDAKDL